MKKITLISSLLITLSFTNLGAQDISQLLKGVDSFAGYVIPALPTASVIGNNWSDAWIGDFLGLPPHFGAGATVGIISLPLKGFQDIINVFPTAALPKELSYLGDFGLPFPVYTVEGRIGGFILPFDVGVKLGMLPSDLNTGDFALDYMLVGADVRYALLKDGLLPGISVGAGVNYLRGGIGYKFPDITLASINVPGDQVYSIGLANPTTSFYWEATVVDVKAQISKSLILITPYAGVGASLAQSTKAGARFKSSLVIRDSLNTVVTSSDALLNSLNNATGSQFTNQGLTREVSLDGTTTFRIFGGASLNLTILKIDLQGIWSFGNLNLPESGSLALSLNARIQL